MWWQVDHVKVNLWSATSKTENLKLHFGGGRDNSTEINFNCSVLLVVIIVLLLQYY